MSLIAFKDLSLTRSALLFTGLTLLIAKGDRLGIVASNGHGKSSLLRILAGQEEATTGGVVRTRGLITAIAPQDPPAHLLSLSLYDAVRDALDTETAETESIEAWRRNYNTARPHSSLGYKPPAPQAVVWPAPTRGSALSSAQAMDGKPIML